MAFLEEFKNLKIQLEEIKLATNKFAENNVIGRGGFGNVYKGEIKGRGMGAIKRLDSRHGQGNSEFWKEIMTLSRYTHENLVSLLGYCDEDGEKILVYEHASRGSLDRYLNATTLTWRQRLKICLAAARGLSYLHDPKETHQRVIHRDIKSSNILLDENWNAKVSDLGLSKIGPANQQHTILVTNVVGTHGYVDPLYMETYRLTKESDVYSFGVVLFEVLCGRLCFGFSNGQWETLVPTWKQICKDKKLTEIIFQDLMQQMDSSSLKTFSDIAYQCLQKSREERPTMARVVKELEIALEYQEISDGLRQKMDYEEIIKTQVPALIYKTKVELNMLLSKGILINGGKTLFSINTNGEHIEMISAAEFLAPIAKYAHPHSSEKNSRFGKSRYLADKGRFKAHVRAKFLSPRIAYTVNLVFKFFDTSLILGKRALLTLKYKLEGETKYSISYLAHEREDGWMMAELYQFTSDQRNFDLKIQFGGTIHDNSLLVEGIEFQPLEQMEHEVVEDEKMDVQPTLASDVDWEQQLPNDYEEIIKQSIDRMEWTTKKELYFLFCKGFRINYGEEWFSLAQNGKKCLMLSASAVLLKANWKWKYLPQSRFEEVAFDARWRFRISYEIKSQLLSSQTTYACYLVYNITRNHSKFEEPMQVIDRDSEFIYLLSPKTPFIRPKVNQNTHNPSHAHIQHQNLPRLRNDGWMEVRIWEFQTNTTTKTISLNFDLKCDAFSSGGFIVEGIEFKPI